MSRRYQRLFAAAGARTAVIPFLVLGDPDLDTSARLLDALAGHGIDAIELGLPFSDPVADGPVVQAASVRALAAGATPERCWTLVERLRARTPDLPIGLLVYANLVVHRGAAAFYHRAALAGADSVLIADVPVAEADPFVAEAERHGIAPVLIAPPNASPERLARIAGITRGYTYVTSRAGVTGARGPDPAVLAPILAQLRALGAPPPVLGFGIAEPDHVHTAGRLGARGVITGSALISRIEAARCAGDDPAERATGFLATLQAAAMHRQGGGNPLHHP